MRGGFPVLLGAIWSHAIQLDTSLDHAVRTSVPQLVRGITWHLAITPQYYIVQRDTTHPIALYNERINNYTRNPILANTMPKLFHLGCWHDYCVRAIYALYTEY